MRKIHLCLVLIIWSISLNASTWIEITSPVRSPARTRLVTSNIEHSVVRFTLDGFNLREVQTPAGPAFVVELPKSTPVQEAGAPDLPKMTVSLVIPDQAGMEVRVISSAFRDYPGMAIAPSKGVIMRDVDPSTVPFQYAGCYSTDKFFPGNLASTREPYIIRNLRGQTVIAYPFQYNPVTKILRVYYDMTVELFKTNENGINPIQTNTTGKKVPQGFLPVFRHQFANLSALSYTPLAEYGNLLVICYGPFMNAMRPYVAWKQAEGYRTEMISKDSAGNTAAAIKSFIANYYATKGLTHVLLVGDSPQIPTNTGNGLGGPSDNAYGYLAGNDHYADVFVGRFSAETEEQVQTQVQRTLDYEENPQFLTDDWYTTVIGIGSDQGPGDDNEMDFEHIRNQQTKLLAYTYTSNPELFDGSQGGNDAPGNPTPAMVSTEVNNGAGLILYTGHGSNTSWGTSGFSNTNVNQLTNAGKLPFIWSVACVNGNFTAGTCFAEAWLRASQNGQPTGALAFLGSTINQSWNSPMEGQDAMTDILVETDSTNIKRTFAGLSINGCMEMIDAYGTDGSNMADTWTIFGDPTIMVRTALPQPMAVSYDTMLFVGDSYLAVVCGVNDARVTATLADTILATGLVVNNTANLTFPALTTPDDTIRLVVTAYNMLPYQGQLIVHAIPSPVVAGFTAFPTHVSPGNHVSFSDTSSGGTTNRQWSFPGGTPSFSTDKNPVITYDNKGFYDVQLISGNSISADTLVKSSYITVDFPSHAGDKTASVSCSVSPNPGNGRFILTLGTPGNELLGLTIYNLVGTIVQHEDDFLCTRHTNKILDLAFLPDGVYFLRVDGVNETLIRKLVIRK
ncbi:MAG: C25 family cysteine peptidase [Bacteroidota bacterium]